MPVIQTTLVRHFKQEGTNAKGAWTRHDFKDAEGQKYQTFENPLANRAYGLLDKPAVVTYEDVKRGDYTNRVIKDIQPVEVSQAPSVAPTASQGPPSNPVVNQFPAISGPDDRQVQIMRQSALERAIRASIGEIDLTYQKSTYDLSEEFLHYFQTGEYPGKPSNEQAVGAGTAPSSSEAALLDEFASQFPDAA